jgi:hypothetical protein
LKNARKALESASEQDKHSAEECVKIANLDFHYALYYPLGTPYVPLYPRKGDDEGEEDSVNESSRRGDAKMRKRVETAMNEGKQSLERLKNELVVNEVIGEELRQGNEVAEEGDSEGNDDGNDFFE